MKKGISIWSFPEAPLEKSFAIAKDAGFEGVEVALDEVGEIALDSTEKDLLKVKAAASDAGIQLYSVACGLCWKYWLTSDDKAERDKAKDIIKKELEVAKILGADTILVVPGAVNSEFAPVQRVIDYMDAYNRSFEAISEVAPYAEQLGVSIGLENVWNKLLTGPVEMRDFIDRIGSPFVGSYFDVGNVLFNGYPEHWIRILGNRIKKVHFKDYRMGAGGAGFVDLLAGDVNYPAVTEALSSVGYDGWVTAEMIPNYRYFSDTIIYNTSRSMDKILGRN